MTLRHLAPGFSLALLLGVPAGAVAQPPDTARAATCDRGPCASSEMATRAPDAVDVEPRSQGLLRQIGGDFRRVFTRKDNLWVLGVGLGAAASVAELDDTIPTTHFNAERFESAGLDQLFEPGEILGGSLAQVGGALLTFGVGKLSSSSEIEAVGRDLVRAQVLTQGMTQLLKTSVRRRRPDLSNRSSFPSGHTSGAFASATVLSRRYGWRVGVPAYGAAAYIGASRLSENKHFLSDVIFGAAIGITAGRTVTVSRGRTRFELSPMVAPGGAGVHVAVRRR